MNHVRLMHYTLCNSCSKKRNISAPVLVEYFAQTVKCTLYNCVFYISYIWGFIVELSYSYKFVDSLCQWNKYFLTRDMDTVGGHLNKEAQKKAKQNKTKTSNWWKGLPLASRDLKLLHWVRMNSLYNVIVLEHPIHLDKLQQ